MPVFASYDGTELGYHILGDGPPLVCLPGGPGRAAGYLGDLGGVSASRQLILLDPRGVGLSADPADPATLRVDLLVRDVDALRAHLGLERIDLLAHSAGAVLATLYAAAHPERLSRLILVTPGLAAVGVGPTEEQVRAALGRRAAEPWYPAALAAMEKFIAGDLSIETFEASRPFFYARWDDASRAHATAGVAPRHAAARQGYFAGAPLDPPSARAAPAPPRARPPPRAAAGRAPSPALPPPPAHTARATPRAGAPAPPAPAPPPAVPPPPRATPRGGGPPPPPANERASLRSPSPTS